MKQILSSMMLFMLLLVGTSAVQAQETEKELKREEKNAMQAKLYSLLF